MKITITMEGRDITVTRTVDVHGDNPRFDAWELNKAGGELLTRTVSLFGDPNDRPANR